MFATVRVLAVSLLLGGLVACSAPVKDFENGTDPEIKVNGKLKTQVVKLQITGTPKQLKVIDGPTKGCMGPPSVTRGCVILDPGQVAVVEFRLLQAQGYDLRRFWICAGDDKPESTDDCALTADESAEFAVLSAKGFDMPGTDGLVDLGGVDGFFLGNQNQIEQTYFYLIEACVGNTNDCTILDPRVRNGGIGNSP